MQRRTARALMGQHFKKQLEEVEQIEKDIKQGKISKKDAKIELDEVKKKLEIQAAIRKLNAGVKSRKLTAEEAAKKRVNKYYQASDMFAEYEKLYKQMITGKENAKWLELASSYEVY